MELNEIHTEHEQATTSMKVVLLVFAVVLVGVLAYFVWNANQAPDGTTDTTTSKPTKAAMYNWSTSAQGPYKDKISYATSTDLLAWADQKKILAEHASVPGAIVKDGTIYLYFVHVATDGVAEKIGLMTSADNGQTWSAKTEVKFNGLGDKVPVDPAPFLMDDGKIRLYYYDINEGRSGTDDPTNKIYSAISTDGTSFTQEDGVRFAKKDIFDPFVLKDGSTWRLYVGQIEGNAVVSATSTDGLTFSEEGTAYSGGAVPFVQKEGATYYLFTAGINIASSTDGSNFTATGRSFLSTAGQVTADPSVLKLADSMYIMFYKTK